MDLGVERLLSVKVRVMCFLDMQLQWRKKMFLSGGGGRFRVIFKGSSGRSLPDLGGSGVMLPQEDLDFYMLKDQFWCVLRA